MKSVELFEQRDFGDQNQYVIRNKASDGSIWPGRRGYPYEFSGGEYIDPGLPVFANSAFRLHIGEGRFLHRGAWDWVPYNNQYAILKSECHLSGEGRWTELCLKDPVTRTGDAERPDVHMIGVGSDYMDGSRTVVENLDLSVDPSVPKEVLVTSGIRGWGDSIRIRNVRITGLRGSTKPVGALNIPYEAFGISFDRGARSIVEDCYVEGENYLSAFSASVTGAKFVDCEAFSKSGYAAFTVYENTKVIDCEAWEFAYGVYNDTDEVRDVHVERSDFSVKRVGVGLVSTSPYHDKEMVRVRDCNFSQLDVKPWVGLELIDKSKDDPAKFEDIEFVGCRFSGESPLTIVSTNSKRVVGVRFIDCMFQKDCKLRSNGNEIEIIRPRNLNGSLRTEQIPQVI